MKSQDKLHPSKKCVVRNSSKPRASKICLLLKMSPQKSSLLDKNMSGVTQYKSTHITPIGNDWYMYDKIVKPLLMTTPPGYACEVDLVQCGCRHTGQKCQTRKCAYMKSRLRCTRACFCGTWCENLHTTCDSDSD